MANLSFSWLYKVAAFCQCQCHSSCLRTWGIHRRKRQESSWRDLQISHICKTITFTSYYWGIQKTIDICIEWRVNINYRLKWFGNEVKDWVVSPGKAIKVLLTTSDNMKEWFRIKAKEQSGLCDNPHLAIFLRVGRELLM